MQCIQLNISLVYLLTVIVCGPLEFYQETPEVGIINGKTVQITKYPYMVTNMFIYWWNIKYIEMFKLSNFKMYNLYNNVIFTVKIITTSY